MFLSEMYLKEEEKRAKDQPNKRCRQAAKNSPQCLNFVRKREKHVANNPADPVGAFPCGRIAYMAVQCPLGILSHWRRGAVAAHCDRFDCC